jgi:AcrR family transcriptional regulator
MATPTASRTQADRRNRDSEIVEAAISVFHRRGFAASTMQDVADAVGVLKGSLYHYISSKEDLLFRILQESHVQARELMQEVSEVDLPAIERLRSYLERMYLWYLSNVERVSVYLNQQHHLTGSNQAEMRLQAREFEHFLRELLAEARGEGSVDSGIDLKLAAYFILGALNSIPRWYHPEGAYSPERIAREFAAMSLRVVSAAKPD